MKLVRMSLDINGTSKQILKKIKFISRSFKIFLAASFLVITLSNYVFLKQFWLKMKVPWRIFFDSIYNLALLFIVLLYGNFSVMSFKYLKTLEDKDDFS